METEIISYLVEKVAAVAEPDGNQGLAFPEFDLDWKTGDRAALFERASQSMQKNGCVILRNFLSTAEAGALLASLEELLSREEIASHIGKRMDHETDDYLINCTFQRFPRGEKVTPTTLFRLEKTIFNVRVGDIGPAGDDGLIDVFRVDGPISECREVFQREKRNKFLIGVLRKASGLLYESRLFNLYCNRGIEETRGYHADGFGPKVKAFLYLDDVSSTDDGPYCFGLGTHDHLALRESNIELYERFSGELKDATFNFWDRRRELKFLGKAGDFCMSFQRGAHRGWPQKAGHFRYALVQTFMPEGMDP